MFTPPPAPAAPLAAVGPVVIAAAPAFWLAAAAAAAAAATCLMLRQLHSGFVTPSVHRALDHIVVALQVLDVSPLPATLMRFYFAWHCQHWLATLTTLATLTLTVLRTTITTTGTRTGWGRVIESALHSGLSSVCCDLKLKFAYFLLCVFYFLFKTVI